jgi:hypothetical protein
MAGAKGSIGGVLVNIAPSPPATWSAAPWWLQGCCIRAMRKINLPTADFSDTSRLLAFEFSTHTVLAIVGTKGAGACGSRMSGHITSAFPMTQG